MCNFLLKTMPWYENGKFVPLVKVFQTSWQNVACGNFVIVEVDAQNGLEIAFQSFRNMPQTLPWFTAPLFVTAAYFKVGQMPVLQFRLRTLDIQIAVFFVETKYFNSLLKATTLSRHTYLWSTVLYKTFNVVAMPLSLSYALICRSCLRLLQLV